MAPSNPPSYILSTSLIEVGVRGRSNHFKRVRQRARPHPSRRPSLRLPLLPRRANLSRGKPGQLRCLLGLATSILTDGPCYDSDRLRLYGSWRGLLCAGYVRITPIWHDIRK